jgi:hypothetical protein
MKGGDIMKQLQHNKISNSMFELSDIEVYKLVHNGNLDHFPDNFWDGVNGLHAAANITRFLLQDVFRWTIEDIKKKTTAKILEENKLGGMLKARFNGSAYLAVANAFPELKEWGEEQYQEQEQHEYTDKELIDAILEKHKELGRIPKGLEMSNPNGATIANRFDSWEKALIKAGLIEDIYSKIDETQYNKEKIIKSLKSKSLVLGRALNKDEIEKDISKDEIKVLFGTMSNLINIIKNEFSKEELIEILQSKFKSMGKVPEPNSFKYPNVYVFINLFGNWQNAVKEAGLT